MGKVLLVEDDNNLREIFEMRLQAEGYQTITASDGEEALAVAMKEKPVLIIADVMMPRLSGFEMLETMRASPEMANVKVVMMTALGQAEDRARGEKLGVVKYLVKSQVTLEDFVRVVREVLPPDQADTAAQPGSAGSEAGSGLSNNNKLESEHSMQDDNAQPSNQPAPQPDSSGASNPISGAPAGGDVGGTGQMSTAQEQSQVQQQVDSFAPSAPDVSGAPASDSPSPSFGGAPADSAGAPSAGGAMPGAAGDSPVAPAPTDGAAPAGDAGSTGSSDAPQSSSADNPSI